MPNIGLSELIVIFMILLLVFGASRLPALGEGIGRTIRGFKKGLSDDKLSGATKAITTPAPKEGKEPAKKVARAEAEDADLIDKS